MVGVKVSWYMASPTSWGLKRLRQGLESTKEAGKTQCMLKTPAPKAMEHLNFIGTCMICMYMYDMYIIYNICICSKEV